MQNLNKIFISYLGGTAGDFFTASCNDELLEHNDIKRVVQNFSIKKYENEIINNKNFDLNFVLKSIPKSYISTHLFEEILSYYKVVSILITNSEVQNFCINRQLELRKIIFEVDEKNSWYSQIKNLCLDKKYHDAAIFYYEQNKNYWLHFMDKRIKVCLEYQGYLQKNAFDCKILNFNKVFTDDFVDDLQKQGWTHNLDIIKKNHKGWLQNNKNYDYENTVITILKKLQKMDWSKKEGFVTHYEN